MTTKTLQEMSGEELLNAFVCSDCGREPFVGMYSTLRAELLRRLNGEWLFGKSAGDGWIPCSERMPELSELVDVVIDGIVQDSPAYRGDAGDEGYAWYWACGDGDPAPEKIVSHWRKRPTFTPAKPVSGPATKDDR